MDSVKFPVFIYTLVALIRNPQYWLFLFMSFTVLFELYSVVICYMDCEHFDFGF
nr:ATP synthase F0 subunit 8 [Perna perna]WRV01112.1 ATP synthase F0 subunit 8 [Perna perna]